MSLLRIGDLARLGGVSVRMLRHYHELGLLLPSSVDAKTGYRSYDSVQLGRLRRIVALKNLGLTLGQVGEILDGSPTDDELRALLLERRSAISNEIALGQANLAALDRYMTNLQTQQEGGKHMSGTATEIVVELKPIAARLVAQLSAVAESWAPEHIGPVIQPLYPELVERMDAAGVAIAGPSTAWYEDTEDGRVHVHATLTIAERPTAGPADLGFEVVDLPGVELAATTVHRGSMDNCDATYAQLLEWIEQNGYQPVGYSRELDIECGPDTEWITELQQAVAVD